MAAWTTTEKADFAIENTGQITLHTEEGRSIMKLLQGADIKTIVEIGTWNGLGSTMCILHGIQGKDVQFWSLECNKEKHTAAVESLSDLIDARVELIWGSVVDVEVVSSEKYLSNFPSLKDSETLQGWFKADLANCMACPKVLKDLPEKIDFLLLDGGEFTSLYEFFVLLPRCSGYIALDDTLTDKCRQVRKCLTESFDWIEVTCIDSSKGFSIFKRV